jgi:hypothetical protein
MLFWLRECLGWVLIALGLYCFFGAMQIVLVDGPPLLEASYFLFVGFVVFRGGLQILKVSVAGRICQEAQRQSAARPTVAPRTPAGARWKPVGRA